MVLISFLQTRRNFYRKFLLWTSFLLLAILILPSSAKAADTVSSAVYIDANGDGTVDTIRWVMDENVTSCTYEAPDWAIDNAGTIGVAITGLTCTGTDAYLDINVTATAAITGGAQNPILSYTQATGTADSVVLTGGAMTDKGTQAATDAAPPIILSGVYTDNNADGEVDRVIFTTSTDVGIVVTAFAGGTDFTVGTAGTVTLAHHASDSAATNGTNTITITLNTVGATNITGGTTAPVVTYTQPGNGIEDGAANDVPTTTGGVTLTDAAAPVILSGVFGDSNVDGEVDQVVFTTTADVGIVCTAFTGATDLTVGTAGTVNLAVNASDSCATNGTSTVTVTLATVGATNVTGGSTAPVVTYTQPGNGIEDAVGNDMPTKAGLTLGDGAAPLPLTYTPVRGATGVAVDADVVVIFSEPMTTGTFTNSISPAVGSLTPVWSNGDKTVTISHATDFSRNNIYTLTIAGTDASAQTVALTQGTGSSGTQLMPLTWDVGFDTSEQYINPESTQDSTDEVADETDETADETTDDSTDQDTDMNEEESESVSETEEFGRGLDNEPVVLGSLVKSAQSSSVYYIDEKGYRHVFTSEAVYKSWYSDFSDVIVVSEELLADFAMGKPVPMHPGKMIKLPSMAEVYLVFEGGVLRHIASQSVAENLFGSDWNKMIYDVDISMFTNYTVGEKINQSSSVDLDALLSESISINDQF